MTFLELCEVMVSLLATTLNVYCGNYATATFTFGAFILMLHLHGRRK